MDEDLEGLEDEFEGAGTAARMLEDSLSGLPKALQGSGSAASGLSGTLASLASASMPSATQAGQQLGSAIGGALTGAADDAAKALSALGPEGEAAGEALKVVASVAADTVGVLATLAGVAVDVTQRLDLMRDRFAALAGSAAGGEKVNAMVEKLSASLPFATAEIQGWAQSLMAAGLQGAQLENSIKAVAAASALMGDQGGAAAENLIKKLAEGGAGAKAIMKQIQEGGSKSNKLLADMGLTTKDLAAAMGMTEAAFAKTTLSADQMNDAIAKALQKKGAGPLDDLGNALPNILQKAREGFLSLFSDLGPAVKPFMSAIKALFGEFDKGGFAINALKPIVTAVFGTLFSWATRAINAIHAGFLIVSIAALKVYIALKPVIDKIKELATSAAFMAALKIAAIALAMPFVVIAAVVGTVVIVVGSLIAAFVAVVAAIGYVVGAIVNFIGGAASALADWISVAASAAAEWVAGLVGGIANGASAVIAAVKNLASGALSAFKSIFGIASPSKVMLEHGEENIAGATATGIDKGGAKVNDAMARMGSGDKGGGGSKGKSSSGGGGNKLAGATINFYGSAKDFPSFEEQANAWLERVAAESPS